jgi:hypothetical protein
LVFGSQSLKYYEFDSWISINPLMNMNYYDYKNHLFELALKKIVICIFCGTHEIKGVLCYVMKLLFFNSNFKILKYILITLFTFK